MTAGAFSGSWADFVRLGLYNARFQNTLVGSIQEGRTSHLPYWTVDLTGAGALTGLSGGGIEVRNVGRLGLRPVMLGALLTYFLGGLWLAGQGQLAAFVAK